MMLVYSFFFNLLVSFLGDLCPVVVFVEHCGAPIAEVEASDHDGCGNMCDVFAMGCTGNQKISYFTNVFNISILELSNSAFWQVTHVPRTGLSPA